MRDRLEPSNVIDSESRARNRAITPGTEASATHGDRQPAASGRSAARRSGPKCTDLAVDGRGDARRRALPRPRKPPVGPCARTPIPACSRQQHSAPQMTIGASMSRRFRTRQTALLPVVTGTAACTCSDSGGYVGEQAILPGWSPAVDFSAAELHSAVASAADLGARALVPIHDRRRSARPCSLARLAPPLAGLLACLNSPATTSTTLRSWTDTRSGECDPSRLPRSRSRLVAVPSR